MTTIVLWETVGQGLLPFAIPLEYGNQTYLIISDSRASKKSQSGEINVITDKCTKLVELNVIAFDNRRSIYNTETVVIAVAGHTLTAHNTVLLAQSALSHLIGESIPTIDQIATFLCDVATAITKEVGLSYEKEAQIEIILIGRHPDDKPAALSLSPTIYQGEVKYFSQMITQFPYAIGSNAKEFLNTYNSHLESLQANRCDAESLRTAKEQGPLLIFDKLFCIDGTGKKSGGEMQIIGIDKKNVTRYVPLRYSENARTYKAHLLGVDITKIIIGNCSIGITPLQVSDEIQVT